MTDPYSRRLLAAATLAIILILFGAALFGRDIARPPSTEQHP